MRKINKSFETLVTPPDAITVKPPAGSRSDNVWQERGK